MEDMEQLAPPVSEALLQTEVTNFKDENLLVSQGDFNVYLVDSEQIPNILNEIGLLREKTFREVGEGTGSVRDIDAFDKYYQQLIIWDKVKKCIAGGYRLGRGDIIYQDYGMKGFYLRSLFKIKKPFINILTTSVELGRSYIIREYQKQRLPLFLLWKGILAFLLKNPQYQYLIGPLSISKNYSNISKEVIRTFVERYFYDYELAKYIKPRKQFKYIGDYIDTDSIMNELHGEIMQLDKLIEHVEPLHLGLPILLKQYIRLNAKIIGFNIDPNFSDVLDGFMVLDLKNVPIKTMESLKVGL